MRPRIIILTIALAIVMAGGLGRQPSSGQEGKREPACGCFICWGSPSHTKYMVFDDGKTTAGKPCSGILAEDACPQEMAYLPDKGKAFCQKIKAALKFTSFKDSCPTLASACEPEEKPECKEQKTPPWFDTGAKCDGVILPPIPMARIEPTVGGVICSINYHVCDSVLVQWRSEYFSTGLRNVLRVTPKNEAKKLCESKGYGSQSVPYRGVCCTKWRQAIADRTAFGKQHPKGSPGEPCDPSSDADCDGTNNLQDPTPLGDCADYSGGPSPKPTPVIEVVPRIRHPRPTSSRIFGSGLLTNPSMAVLPGFWTKPCTGSQLESNL